MVNLSSLGVVEPWLYFTEPIHRNECRGTPSRHRAVRARGRRGHGGAARQLCPGKVRVFAGRCVGLGGGRAGRASAVGARRVHVLAESGRVVSGERGA